MDRWQWLIICLFIISTSVLIKIYYSSSSKLWAQNHTAVLYYFIDLIKRSFYSCHKNVVCLEANQPLEHGRHLKKKPEHALSKKITKQQMTGANSKQFKLRDEVAMHIETWHALCDELQIWILQQNVWYLKIFYKIQQISCFSIQHPFWHHTYRDCACC